MTYLPWLAPWVAFLLAMAWMTRQGFKAKKEYLRNRKAEEKDRTRANRPIAERVL
jgi:cytochrome c-type biogenesis protein CcmH/NrfF